MQALKYLIQLMFYKYLIEEILAKKMESENTKY